MAGAGSRFTKAGYTVPKYLIEVEKKTLLEYSLDSLPLEIATKIVFVALQSHEDDYGITAIIKDKLKGVQCDLEFVFIPEITKGQAETVLKAESHIEEGKDLLIYNIDTYARSNGLKNLLSGSDRHDGVLGAFHDEEDKWSFAKVENGFVTETAEKIPISTNALTGLYHFSNGMDFVRVARKCIDNGTTFKNEYYIAPMYNELIKEGKKFVVDIVDEFIALGTPEDIKKLEAK